MVSAHWWKGNHGSVFFNDECARMNTNFAPSATKNASGISFTIPRKIVTLSAVEASL